ncbi:hypothetical protein BDR26DRAFT_1004986 [Obelidium mucronatum]|nr:hypothetical protein BDR26DRAFT_1004986 [Obelidium mucronatum]
MPAAQPPPVNIVSDARDAYADLRVKRLGNPFVLLDSGCALNELDMFDLSEEAQAQYAVDLEGVLAKVASAKEDEKYPDSAISLKALFDTLQVSLEDLALDNGYTGALLSTDFNPLLALNDYFSWAPVEFSSDDHFKRLEFATAQFDVVISNLRIAMDRKLTMNRESVSRLIKFCFQAASVDVMTSPICVPTYAQKNPLNCDVDLEVEKPGLAVAAQQVLDGYQRLGQFLQVSYLPQARTHPGIFELPNYETAYQRYIMQYCLEQHSAHAINDIGLSEIRRIEKEIVTIMSTLGHRGTIQAFGASLRDRQKFPELFEIDKDAAFDKFTSKIVYAFESTKHFTFGALRIYKYEMQKVERVSPKEEDSAPLLSVRNTPTRFAWDHRTILVNSRKLVEAPSHQWEAIILNQSGRLIDFHLSHQWEGLVRANMFQRIESKTTKSKAWAAYAESCGADIGFYNDPLQLFGKLERELINSIMLVIDTGLHTRGWTIEQSTAFITENAAYITPEDALELVLQACEAPGKALAPKMGELRIRKLRAKVEEEFPFKDLVLMGFNQTALETEFYKGGEVLEYAMELRMKSWRTKRDN